MRKLWYAGVVAAFVFGAAAPAQADLLPGAAVADQQADQRLADVLGRDGVDLQNPLRYSTLGNTPVGSTPLMQMQAGANDPDLRPILPGGSESAAEPRPDLPAADVVGGALRRPGKERPSSDRLSGDWFGDDRFGRALSAQQARIGTMALSSLFTGDVPLLRGLLPSGGVPSVMQRPTVRQAEAFDGGMPLLGGLGGVLPVNELPVTARSAGKPDTSGLPAGGMAVLPAASAAPTAAAPTAASPAATSPAAASPSAATPATDEAPKQEPTPDATPDDPRLHEEPVDDEASHRRPFSADGRPVSGIDREYK